MENETQDLEYLVELSEDIFNTEPVQRLFKIDLRGARRGVNEEIREAIARAVEQAKRGRRVK